MEIKRENVGVDLHRLDQQDQIHLPRPNRGYFPMFWVVGPIASAYKRHVN
jgi:hypothetical protein